MNNKKIVMVHPKNPEKNNKRKDTDEEARRDPAQSHDNKEEAQNINDDTKRPSDENELRRSRNKANEGKGPEVIL